MMGVVAQSRAVVGDPGAGPRGAPRSPGSKRGRSWLSPAGRRLGAWDEDPAVWCTELNPAPLTIPSADVSSALSP